ncbi:MAG TPA: carboxypeptidase M32, partial [Anaerolineales bacterium]
MDPEGSLTQLKQQLNEVTDLLHIRNVLSWDQQTHMPPGGTRDRGHHRATISRLAHVKYTSDEIGALLEKLEPYAEEMDPDSDDARLVKVTARQYEKRTKVPADLVAQTARVTAEAHPIWQEAKAESNFRKFQPYLENIVDLRRQYAQLFAPFDHIYDPLLDDYEPGMKTTEVQAIFSTLRPQQVELIQAITA